MPIRIPVAALATLVVTLATSSLHAADIAEAVATDCGACHQLTGPAATELQSLPDRGGPPLFYAGNKFREDWLVTWLQDPTRIRPAGDYPPAHVVTGSGGDEIDEETLVDHPALPAETALEVATYLMTLTPHDQLIAAEDYTPQNIPETLGAMDFVKFKGCAACHRDTPELGGVSGPELYTAWARLQPEYIVSYIRNPIAWEPLSLMPNKHLQTEAIHKLANYLRVISEPTEANQ